METAPIDRQMENGTFSQESTPLPSPQTVGMTAGVIWNYLGAHGKTSVILLKSEIQCTATILHLSLGWLLREDKIEILAEKGQLAVQLK